MGVLWISLLLISFEPICAIELEEAKLTNVQNIEPSKDDYQIKYFKVLNADIVDTNINFNIEFRSNSKVYSYLLETRILKTLNDTMDIIKLKYNNTIYFFNDNYVYYKNFSFKYFPATTYQIQISTCSNQTICEDYTIVNRYKYPRRTFYHTQPMKPTINFINITSCNNKTCIMDVNIANLQISNSSLYGYQQKNERNITNELVKSLIKMKIENAIEFYNTTNNSEGIKIPLKYICNNYSYLILVNDYLEEVNYDTHHLSSNQTYCSSENYNKTNRNLEGNANNYYYLLIIPAVLIIIGIIIFIKRKSLHKFYKQIADNQHEMAMEPSTIIPLVRKNNMKLVTPKGLQLYLQNNSEEIINNLKTEFMNVGQDTSQKTFGESFEDKNRYNNILPYEETRVKLNLLENKVNSHYINASYIKGYSNNIKYIATQGPTIETRSDFWRMIWQENITLIIILTNTKENGQEQCGQYWPDKDLTLFSNYQITVQKVEKFVEYTRREFVLTNMKINRIVTQMHFTIWNEKGIPQTPYSLVKLLKETRNHTNCTILVHCNDGINRTGTFILCDYIIDMAESGTINFPQALYTLRQGRKSMVQNDEQYLYAYCVVNEFLNGNFNTISVDEFKENNVSEEIVMENLIKIKNSSYWLKLFHPAIVYDFENRTLKEKFHNKKSYTSNIYTIEILKNVQNLIINKSPNTIRDFWMMVLEKKLSLILSLQELETSIKFWPAANETLNPVDNINITLIQDTSYDTCNKIHVKLDDTRNNDINYVHILHFKKWKRNSLPKIDEFLFYHKMYSQYRERTIVACGNAMDASSIFLTFLFLVDTLNQNSTIDVNTAISTLKIYRRNFNVNKEKLTFIYDALKIYLQNVNKDFSEDYVKYQNF